MTTHTHTTKLTYGDYLLFPDDGKRHEIIDGVHYMAPAPSRRHQKLLGNLYWRLRNFLHEHPLGEIYFAPFDVVMSEHDVVQPDLIFVTRSRLEVLTEANLRGVPDLAVEILSPSTRRTDERIKLGRYDELKIEEYWIVDPEPETVRVYRRSQGGLQLTGELHRDRGETLTSPLFPGLALPLALIFED